MRVRRPLCLVKNINLWYTCTPRRNYDEKTLFIITFIIDDIYFNDADKIASWANEALSSLVKTGTVGGYNNNLYPTATTTRAEIAQVLYNLLSK